MNTIAPSFIRATPSGVTERRYSVSLRPRTLAEPSPLISSDLPLWALLSETAVRELQVTYSLRRAQSVAVQVNLVTCSGGSQGKMRTESRRPTSKDWGLALQRAALLALPDCFVTDDELDREQNHRFVLSHPTWNPTSLLAANNYPQSAPRPEVVSRPAAGTAVLLSRHYPMRLTLSEVLRAATQVGLDLDLTLSLRRLPLLAEHLRSLRDLSLRLSERLHDAGVTPFTRLRMLSALSRVEGLAAAGTTVAIEVEVGVRSGRDRSLAATLSPLLFGADDFGLPDNVPVDDVSAIDLSGRILPFEPKPSLVPEPGVLSSLRFSRPQHPRRSSEPQIEIGRDEAGESVAIELSDLAQHAYLIGGSGTGKSTLMASMIRDDIRAGRGVFLIDPHGELFGEVRDALSPQERARTILADVSDLDNPFTLNLLEISGQNPEIQRNFICNQMIALFKGVYGNNKEAFGPMFEMWYRNALLLLMQASQEQASLADFERIFVEPQFRRSLLEECDDEHVVRFWRTTAVRAGGDASLENIVPYIVSKNTQLTGNALLRPIICSRFSTLAIPEALSTGRTVLVNLARGIAGGPDAALLGGIITIKLFAAAMARIRSPAAERSSVRVYLDEFPTFASPVLGEMIAEVRKFGLSMVLANQSLGQIDHRGSDIAHAILANVGSIMAFRLGPSDARSIAQWFGPEVDELMLTRLPNHQCVARLLAGGVPSRPNLIKIAGPSDQSARLR